MALDEAAEETGALSLRVHTPDVARATATSSTALDASRARALLAELPPLPAPPIAPPIGRPPSAAPPRTGAPPTPIAMTPAAGKLLHDATTIGAPVRPAPELAPPEVTPAGEIEASDEIRVRFAEPMVPVAVTGTTAAVPISLSPPLRGAWRWQDTRVAIFHAAGPRMPAATEVTVTIPAGMEAVSGARLREQVRHTFSTSAPRVLGVKPEGSLRPDSAIAVELDQDIDPAALATALRIERFNGSAVRWRRVEADEARALWSRIPGFAPPALDVARTVFLAPTTAWPAGQLLRVVLGKGASSREGPRRSTEESAADFRVAPPLTLLGAQCGNMSRPRANAVCFTAEWASLALSNPLRRDPPQQLVVREDGAPLPAKEVLVKDDALQVRAPARDGQRATFELVGDLVDQYGQRFTGPRRVELRSVPEAVEPFVDSSEGTIVLDPRFKIPQWVVHADAVPTLRVQLYRVEPRDYFAFLEFQAGERAAPPGKRVQDRVHPCGRDQAVTARVDLRPALDASGVGHVVAIASGGPASRSLRQLAWIQVTRLGVSARVDGARLSAWVAELAAPAAAAAPAPSAAASATATAGATAALLYDDLGERATTATDDRGHASLTLPPASGKESRALVIARRGADSVFAELLRGPRRAPAESRALWYVTDDRFTYKPGESLYIKGWLRWYVEEPDPQVTAPTEGDAISYRLLDARDALLASGTVKTTPQGGFDLEAKIPPEANLGAARLELKSRGEQYTHWTSLEEFRTPTFSIQLDDDVTHRGATPLFAGEAIEMSASATYFGGGRLTGAAARWDATLTPAAYRPPGWDRFTFTPADSSEEPWRWRSRESVTAHATASLSPSSTTAVKLAVPALRASAPALLSAEVAITDLDRHTLRTTSRAILVHPAEYYVGLRDVTTTRSERSVELVVTTVDGALVSGVPVEVTLERKPADDEDPRASGATPRATQRCQMVSGAQPVRCAVPITKRRFGYVATARVVDRRGRSFTSYLDLPWWSSSSIPQALTLEADREFYRPGDVARVAVQSDEFPATAIVTVARSGMVSQRQVTLAAKTTTVEIPIAARHAPNLHVVVDRVTPLRPGESGDAPQLLPRHVSAELELRVDIEGERLDVVARPARPQVAPGEEATFQVEVRHQGAPVAGAEVALLAVDEAVLAQSDRRYEDPLAPFFFDVTDGTEGANSQELIHDDEVELEALPGVQRESLDDHLHSVTYYGSSTGYGALGGGVPTVRVGAAPGREVRRDFRATAVWAPRLTTDSAGRATVSVKLPDSLTRYRIVALASAELRRFGKGESTVATRRALVVRPVAPRFLNQGDAFSLPVIVQNLDEEPRQIEVAVRASNLRARGPVGQALTLAPGARAELRFPFTAQARGAAHIQALAASGAQRDSVELELPVYEPATTESFAAYGVVEDTPGAERLLVPEAIHPDVGGVVVELASTQLQTLTDAFSYLQSYPYECAEQRSSRMLATTAMADVLEAFAAAGRPSRAALEATRAADVAVLGATQSAQGGWGYFRGMKEDPFVSVQVLSALALGGDRSEVTKGAVRYVTALVTNGLTQLEALARRPVAARRAAELEEAAAQIALTAAALGALADTGVAVAPRAERLHRAAQALRRYPLEAQARLLALVAGAPQRRAMRDELRAGLLGAIRETAASAGVEATFSEAERALLPSATRTSALALAALIREAPAHPVIPKLVRGLLDARRRGRWGTTQENVAALRAMRSYFDRYEHSAPAFTGRLWFGARAYGEQAFSGRDTSSYALELPWSALTPGTADDVTLVRAGTGRLYYRLGITYAPTQRALPALDAGFVVRRSYAAEDAADLSRTADGALRVKLGAKLRVTVEVTATARRYGVAVVDPLPAGFEPVNPRLATAERALADHDQTRWDHINLRDTRSEAFRMDLPRGTYRHVYSVRATTPGTFAAAPARAEEMYSPETFGRSATTTVVIE